MAYKKGENVPIYIYSYPVPQPLRRKVAGSIPDGAIDVCIDIVLLPALRPWGVDSTSNRNEYQEYLLGVKTADPSG